MLLLMLTASCGSGGSSDNTGREERTAPDYWAQESIAYRRWASPASPYRNEARYIRFIDSLLTLDSLPEGLRERADNRRQVIMLNRPGSIASDFRFLERHGNEASLHSISAPLTLLLFYDPECPHCKDILNSIASSGTVNTAIDENRLTVIAVYAEGKRDVWEADLNDMPDNWLVGYDLSGILDNQIYDLPAMPTPYLLDSDKRVILKDPQIPVLISRIAQ